MNPVSCMACSAKCRESAPTTRIFCMARPLLLAAAALFAMQAALLYTLLRTASDVPDPVPPCPPAAAAGPANSSATKPRLREATREDRQMLADLGTSMWCTGRSSDDRQCKARHLCLRPASGELVLLQSPQSVLRGVPLRPFAAPFLDLTAILDHNLQHAAVADLDATSVLHDRLPRILMVDGAALLFRRFYSHNIFHTLHDDLIPLYVTLQQIGRDVQLVYLEGWPPGEFVGLFSLLSATARDPTPLHPTHACTAAAPGAGGLCRG